MLGRTGEGSLSWARSNPLAVLAGCLLAAVLVLHVVILTSAPPTYGDEAWISSYLHSLISGDGFRSPMAADYEIYDVGTNYWTARIGSLPQVAGALVGPETFTFQRIVSFLTALVALGIFWLGLRRVHGATSATFAAAALATTWGFFSASHWIRWDPMGLVVAAAVLAILLSGPPSPRACLGLGVLLGVSPDWAYPLMAVAPGVLLLALWEPGDRMRRLGALAGGLGIGLIVFLGLHVFPNPDAASEQYDKHFRASYGEPPLVQVVEERSLQPVLHESYRYELLLGGVFRPSAITLMIGLIAAVIVLLRVRGAGSRRLAVGGFAAIGVGLSALFIHHVGDFYLDHPDALDAIRYAIFALVAVALAGVVWLFLRDRPAYPRRAVASILLVSQLAGLGLILAFKEGSSSDWALGYAVAAVVSAAELLVPAARRQLAVAVVMTALTLGGATYMVESANDAEPEPALDDDVARVAQDVVPPGRTVLGEHVYWWLYRDDRYRANTAIWFQQYIHPEYDFEEAFHALNPDYVLLDDLWLARYPYAGLPGSASEFWPNEAPHDPREQAWLVGLLRSEYRKVKRVDFEGKTLVFWERKDLALPGRAASG